MGIYLQKSRHFSPGKIIVAFIIVCLIYIIPHHLTWNSEWQSPVYINGLKSTPNTPGGSTTSSSSSTSKTTTSTIRKDAHRIPNADGFLSHFESVINAPGMTMAEAKSGCNWPDMGKVNFQYAPDAEWVVHEESDKMLDARREEWQLFIQNELVPWQEHQHKFEGRGIVIVSGQLGGLRRVKVILEQLKLLGSKLPIEINYWDEELNQTVKDDIASMWPKMYFNDLSSPDNVVKTKKNYDWANFQLKTAAVANSRFAEPLLLDSDNVPVIDPESLYEDEVYKEYGTVFWPDIARTRPSNPMWALTNTKCRMDEYEQESGQMLVDKRKYFYHLQLAAWFNNRHAPYYIRFMLGDKDLFRFAWHALKTEYGRPNRWLTSVGTVSPDDSKDGYYCGHTFAQHHPSNGSVAFLHGGLLKVIPREVMQWHMDNRGGIFQYYKQAPHADDPSFNQHVGIQFTDNNWWKERPKNLRIGSCTELFDVKARPLDELVPGFQETFKKIGGYWMMDDPTYTPGIIPPDSDKNPA